MMRRRMRPLRERWRPLFAILRMIAVVVEAAALRLRRGDPALAALDLRGEPIGDEIGSGPAEAAGAAPHKHHVVGSEHQLPSPSQVSARGCKRVSA